MVQNKDPMSLENLPEYLKSLQENGGTGGAPVVNTGQIVSQTSSSNWLQGFLVAALLILTLGLGSAITYNAMSTKNITVIVDIDNADSQTISKIVADGGGEVVSVEQKDADTFEVELKTRKSRGSFLDWLRGNSKIKKAELED